MRYKYLIFISAFVILCLYVRGQGYFTPSKTNLYDIKEEQEAYFSELTEEEFQEQLEDEGSEYSLYMKWLRYWEPRLAPHGDIEAYMEWENDFYSGGRSSGNTDPWFELGPYEKPQGNAYAGIGHTEFVSCYSENSNYLLCGSLRGGLFFSVDGGDTWTNGGSDVQWERSGCSWACFAPSDYQTWYAASSGEDNGTASFIRYTGGIYRTVNQGANWVRIADYNDFNGIWTCIYKFEIEPSNANIMYVATSDGIYKTTNLTSGTVTWSKINNNKAYDLELVPGANGSLYAAIYDASISNWKVIYSTDYGTSWSTLPNHPSTTVNKHITIEVTNANADLLYVFMGMGGLTDILYRYDNSSQSWTLMSDENNSSFGAGHTIGISQFDEDVVFLGYGTRYRSSDDGGQNWNSSTGIFHSDVEDILFDPNDEDVIYMASHAGVYISYDQGQTWNAKFTGLGIADVLKMDNSYTNPGFLAIGTYHDGTLLTDGNYTSNWAPSWNFVLGCDGLTPIIDYTNPQYVWASTQYAMFKSSSYGASGTYSHCITTYPWVVIGTLHPEDPTILYSNQGNPTNEVVRSVDRGSTFTTISDFETTHSLTSYIVWDIFTAPSDGDYLYIHLLDDSGPTRVHKIFMTTKATDLASTVINDWVEITTPCPDKWFSDLEVDLEDPDIIYLAYSSPTSSGSNGSEMIFKIDVGTQTTTDLTYNLPNASSGNRCLAVEKGSDGGIYFATDFGVYFTNNKYLQTASPWKSLGTNLPRVGSGGLEINYKINKLRIGTSGRGVWEHDLYCPEDDNLTEYATYIANVFREVQNTITSGSIVNTPFDVSYRAGNRIYLEDGFRAYEGCKFHAFIHPCSGSGNSFRSNDQTVTINEEEEQTVEKENLMKEIIKVYPNPNNGQFTIELPEDNMKSDVSIFNTQGDMIYNEKDVIGNDLQLSIPNQAKGIYFIKVKSGLVLYTHMFQIQ